MRPNIITIITAILAMASTTNAGGQKNNSGNNNNNNNNNNGGRPIENHPCYEPTDPRSIASAAKTTGSCSTMSCPGGCCRYHTSFLTCDTRSLYAHQPCICNELTDNSGRSGNNSSGSNVPIGVGSGGSSPAPRPPTPAPPANPVPVPPSNPGRPPSSPASCEEGSVWQTLGLPFENCASSSDCEGVTVGNSNRPTCCKRSFCWCGAYDVEAQECVMS